MQTTREIYVHGTTRSRAEQICRQQMLRSSDGEIWAAPASPGGREMAMYYGTERAVDQTEDVVLIYFRAATDPDELEWYGEVLYFAEWEACWHQEGLPIEVVRTEHIPLASSEREIMVGAH